MRALTLPYSGELLLTQLMAFGLLVALDEIGVTATIVHDPASLTFDPAVQVHGDLADTAIAEAIAATARRLHTVIEEDFVARTVGNARRSVIWARGTFAADPTQARVHVARRAAIIDAATDGHHRDRLVVDLLAALGCPVTWGGGDLKPAFGATALDGVLGNHTSDVVRGLLRPACKAATAPPQPLWSTGDGRQLDKSGWAPPGTTARLDHQWLAVLGTTLLPVAHRAHARSQTPATWRETAPRRASGVVLPLLGAPVTLARLRALLASAGLEQAVSRLRAQAPDVSVVGALRVLGITDLVVFERLDARGSGSSVAFTFRRASSLAI